MIPNKFKNIIVKYLTNQANSLELDELEIWIQNPNNEKLFNSYVRTNYAIEFNLRKFDSKRIKTQLIKEISKERKVFKLKRRNQIIRYAAASLIVGVLTTTYFFRDNLFNKAIYSKPVIVNTNIIKPGTDKATLTLDDGSQIALEKGSSIHTQSASSNGEEIIYKDEKSISKEIAYNYLTVPNSGQFHVVLADGTEVWLNSEYQLKYPVSFIDGESRKVELVYGEAYFNVSPSTKHKGSKFKVINQSQEVEVLGTEFNIKAYKDETNIYTTLVEGKVAVSSGDLKLHLKPNYQSNLDIKTNVAKVEKIDIYNEISWKEGVFSFDGKSIQEIMKVLSRWYDIKVIYTNNINNDLEFVGIFRKNKTIEEILSTIKKSGIIKDYKINKNEIILK